MDYSKKGLTGTTPAEMVAQAPFTRAISTGGGASIAEMAHNGAAREACAKAPALTPADLAKACK